MTILILLPFQLRAACWRLWSIPGLRVYDCMLVPTTSSSHASYFTQFSRQSSYYLLLSFAAQHLHLLGQGFGTHIHRSCIAHAGTRMRDPLRDGRPKQPNGKRWRRLGTVGAGNEKRIVERKRRDFSLVNPLQIAKEIGRLA